MSPAPADSTPDPPPEARERARLEKLNRILGAMWESNAFHSRKWQQAGLHPSPLSCLDDLASYPLTTRAELHADQCSSPPFGTNLSVRHDALKRFHRTSGTTGASLLWADSIESWDWVTRCSQRLWQLAGVQASDRILFLAPFGASSGPWILYEGACRLGAACFPLGQTVLAERERQHWLATFKPTVVAGNPGALEALALAGNENRTTVKECQVHRFILCGRHTTRLRLSLEAVWGGECFDRYGLTEAGSVACECGGHFGGLHLLDDAFIAECLDAHSGAPVPDGEPGELVLTTLGRFARPIVRYCTGDIVRLIRDHPCGCGRRGTWLIGSIDRRIKT